MASSTASLPAYIPPRLVILKQSSLAEEAFTAKDGEATTLHVVVKHSPFLIQLGLASSSNLYPSPPMLDLNRLSFEAKLFYDGSEKEVDFVKLKPLEYKVRVNDNGSRVNVECRLKVLSSQLEDMNFRIKFIALDPITQREISPLLTTISEPIKVISKPEQIRKKKTSKKTISDQLIDTLVRIDHQHTTQSALLNKLATSIEADLLQERVPTICASCRQGLTAGDGTSHLQPSILGLSNPLSTPSSSSSSSSSSTSSCCSTNTTSSSSSSSSCCSSEPPSKRQKKEDYEEMDFETSFSQLMEAYENLKPEERLQKIQLAIIGTGISGEYLSELIDLFSAEGLQREIGSEVAGRESLFTMMEDCECVNCPHRQELKRIEDFYKEVFSI